MPRLSPIRGRDLVVILTKLGFETVRQKGSHLRLVHNDGRKTTVPIHSILRDVDLSPEEFEKLR